ncbi:MAG: hypothetical protein HC896_00340 [Bacteroidales bacterium]|nr:hypothetical protein [Bacteroidales bacterium]
MVDQALRNIFYQNYTGIFEEELWRATLGELNKAVDQAFKDAKPGTPDKAMANKFKFNNALFSAYKSANQTQTLKLLKAAGKANTFAEYKKQAAGIVNDYNNQWLKTEYASAKARARSAKNWQTAVNNADLYPNIEYLPSIAADPREDHKQYYHVVRPINDPFWDSHLPPISWRCQCQWKTTDAPAKQAPTNLPQPQPGLDSNPGKTGAIFSQTHNYFDFGNDQAVVKQTIASMHGKSVNDVMLYYMDTKTKGVVYSFGKMAASERVNNIRTAIVYAKLGNEVYLPSQFDVDSIINGIFNEFKHPQAVSKSAFFERFYRGMEQFRDRKIIGDQTLHITKDTLKGNILNGLKNAIHKADAKGFKPVNNVHFIIEDDYQGSVTIAEILTDKLPF